MKNTFTKLISRLLLILCLLFTGYNSFAQYTANTITTGNGLYTAMAKDLNNNSIYVVRNSSGNDYEVVKFLGGNPAVSTVLITGLNAGSGNSIYPWGLAVNSIGDVFVTNSNQDVGWQIIKWRAATGTSAVIQSGNYYSSLAIDRSDNLLSIEYDAVSNNYQVWKYPAGMESSTGSVVYNGIAYPAGSYTFPWGLSVDSHNDIYFLGFLETNGGSLNKLSYPSYSLTTLGTNKSYTSLAIDAGDNLYTSEGTSSTTAQVVKYTYPVAVNATGTVIYSGLSSGPINYPWGLAVNSSGRIFANDGAAAGNGRVLRLDPPVSLVNSVTRLDASPSNAGTVRFSVVFDRAVTGVSTSSFGLTTSGSLSSVAIGGVSGSGTTYTVTVNTGTGDGTLRLNVTGSDILPTVANAPYTSGEVYTIDKTKPTGSLIINSGATLTNNTAVTLTTTATDASSIQMRFSTDGSSYSAYEAYAASKALSVSAGDGLKTVYVEYLDAAGNVQGYNATITLDQTVPTATITSSPLNPTNSSSANFTFTSSEAGSIFQSSIDGGPFLPSTSPLSISGIAEGPHSFLVRARDAAGNFSSLVSYNWTVDQTAPTVTSVSGPANGYYVIGSSLRFVVNYAENVIVNTTGGTPYLNVILSSGTVQASYESGSGTGALTFRYVVVDGDADNNGPGLNTTLVKNGSTMTDAAGNDASVALLNLGNFSGAIVNTIRPTVVMTTVQPSVVNHPLSATITFSEAVTGFSLSDFIPVNATVTSLTTSDNITYNVTFTPIVDGNVQINVPASVVTNVVGNPNSVSNTLNFTYDATSPFVSSVSVPANGYYNAGNVLNFTVTFNEPVNLAGGNPSLDLTIGSSSVAATFSSSTANSLTFSYTVADGDQDMNGIVVNSLVLNGSTIKDVAGNDATLTLNSIGNTANVKVNTTHPTVTLSAPAARFSAPFTATITFSEAVTGFAAGDIVPANAIVTNLQTSDNITFTALVTPTAEGNVTLNVAADVAMNIGSNGNQAAAQLVVIYDTTPPVVTSVSVPANGYYKAADVLTFTVTFGDPVTSTGTPELNITIGSSIVQAALVSSTASSLTFSYTVVDGDLDMDGIAVDALVLNGGTIKDAAGNNATLTLNNIANTSAVYVNTVHPSVVVSTSVPEAVNTAFTATFTFSEAVTGFVPLDISATNATVSNLQTTDNITYTALITPAAGGTVTVKVPAVVVKNIANNDNSASNTLSILYDITSPEVSSVTVPATGYYKSGQELVFKIHFNEDIRINTTGGTPYLTIAIGVANVRAFYDAVSNTFRYTVQTGDMDLDGIITGTLVLNGGTIRDTVGNNAVLILYNVANTSYVRVNTVTPSVVLSTAAAARINTDFDVKIVFSEAVTGMSASLLNVTNGTAGNLQTTDNITYTTTVTPTTDGTVKVYLAADEVTNTVGNGNTLSNTVSLVYDITAPLITAGQAFNTSERSPVGTAVGTVAAIETAGTLQNWTITSDESGGAFSIDNTGNITVADATILGTLANPTVHLTFTVSDGLNISSGESVAITIKFVNQAPTLDVIANAVMCTNTDEQTVQLTGASATETDQTYSFSIMADQSYFDALAVSATGLITYKLKAGAVGMATVTVTIKDDGGISNGGVDSLRRSFTVTANSLPVIGISSDKGTAISKGDIIHLTATGGNSYSWDAADGNISGEQRDILEARPMVNTTYKVTVTSAETCSDTATIMVKVVEDFKVDAVNIMSPNGDGKNDKWVIQNIDSYPNNEVKIFDRTGRMVYSRRNYNNEWDATMNGSPLAEGTYYYILTFGGNKTAKGFITIIRDKN